MNIKLNPDTIIVFLYNVDKDVLKGNHYISNTYYHFFNPFKTIVFFSFHINTQLVKEA